MTQQQIMYQEYDNNDLRSYETSPITATNSDSKYNNNNISPLSSISSRMPAGQGAGCNNDVNYKIYNNNNYQNYYCKYYDNGDSYNCNINENIDCCLNFHDYIEENGDDNTSECNSLGNATFVPAPLLYSNCFDNSNEYSVDYDHYFYNENQNSYNVAYNNNYNNIATTMKHNNNNNDFIAYIQNTNDDADDTTDDNINENKEIKTKTNIAMMSISDLQYTLDEILNMNALLYYTTNIEGSKLIQYLLENEENGNSKISNTTFYSFNKQLLSKDEKGNTIGLLLCCNIYGNYVIQKYLSVAPFYFVDEIICQIICPNAYQLAFDKHGSRVLQYVISNNNNSDDNFNNHNSFQNDNNADIEHTHEIPISTNNNNNNDSGIRLAMKKLDIYSYYILYHISLDSHLIECIENISVNHVIQKCIHHLNKTENINKQNKMLNNNLINEEENDQDNDNNEQAITKLSLKLKHKLFDMMLIQMQTKLYEFSLHKYGCRIIQNLLDFGNVQQKNFIIFNLIPFLLSLSCDKYGNYVIQKMIFYNRVLLCNNQHNINNSDVMSTLIANFYQLCLNKYGSNVAELCYQYSNDTQKQFIIQKLSNNYYENNENINDSNKEKIPMAVSLIKHEFGNYVVQKIISLSNEKQKCLLLNIIKKYLSYLKHQSYKYPCIKLFIKNFFPSSSKN